MNRAAAIAAALLLVAPLAPAFAAEDTRFGLDAEVTHDDGAQLRATYLYRFQ